MNEMGANPDYVRLADEVLGIRNTPPALARKLVAQALVMEDRRDEWTRVGERICLAAPAAPGVYVLRDASGTVLYVGKANNLRRRLRAHFAPRRWRQVKADFARVADAEWATVGSELEALLLEAQWIRDLLPTVNIQTGPPSLQGRTVPSAMLHDVVIVLPSNDPNMARLVAARVSGQTLIQNALRTGEDLSLLATRLWQFFSLVSRTSERPLNEHLLAPIVFSWLAGRGAAATRFQMRELTSSDDLQLRLSTVLGDRNLFSERIVLLGRPPRL